MTQPMWIRILPGPAAARLKTTLGRDVTEEAILAELDVYNGAVIVPVQTNDWMPEVFEGLMQRQPVISTVYLTPDQVQNIRDPLTGETFE